MVYNTTFIASWLYEHLNELGVEVVECDYEKMDNMVYAELSIGGHSAYIRGDLGRYYEMTKLTAQELTMYSDWTFQFVHGKVYEKGTMSELKVIIDNMELIYGN